MSRLAVLDAPLDSSGAGRGEERGPEALRAAGVLARLGARDAGGIRARIRDSRRDSGTGVIGAPDVRRASEEIAGRIWELLETGDRPLVLGGDCTLLLGVFAGLPKGCGLWFVDGHADFYDGESSPSGEAADMDLAILTGHGPTGLIAAGSALLDPAAVLLLGHRPDEASPDVAEENARIDPAIEGITAPQIRARGAARTGTAAAARLASRPTWLHLDLDVLDAVTLPAVTYPLGHGLGWDELVALCRPLAAAPNLLGISVADFNPDRDANGSHAARVVDALAELLL